MVIWETEEDIGNHGKKLKIEKGGNDSLLHENKEDIQSIFHKPMDFLKPSIPNNNNNNNNNINNIVILYLV